MFHMDRFIRSRKVIRDVTYKWVPFLFVVLTVIVCTALLSTSGKPPRGIVVTFSVMAGLLVLFFMSCHLVLYCTGIKHQMDAERANGDNGDADPSPQLDGNIPSSFFNANANANLSTREQQRGRGRSEQDDHGRAEQHRYGQYHPDHSMGRHSPNRSPAARHDFHGLDQVAGYGSDQPYPRSESEIRVHQQNPPQSLGQRPRKRTFSDSSAAPAPLRQARPPCQAGRTQQRPRPDLARKESPTRPPYSRPTSGEDGEMLHSARTTRIHMEATPTPPHQPPQRYRAAPRDAVPRETLQHSALDNQLRGRISIARRVEKEMFLDRAHDSRRDVSALSDAPSDQDEPRGYPAGTLSRVQARFALLAGPDVWDLASRLLSNVKPRAQLGQMPADDCLGRPPSGIGDADTVIILRDIDRKPVQVHPAAPELERVRSQKALAHRVRLRDSNDSGYYSADSNQHPPSLPQPPGTSTAAASTLVSSVASTCPPSSSGPSLSLSVSAGSEWYSPRTSPFSSISSEWLGWHGRVSMGDEGTIEVAKGMRRRDGRPRPLGRSKTF